MLGGSGLAWQDEAVHQVGPGDCVVHTADTMEHTFVAGPDGLDYLVFGTNHPTEQGRIATQNCCQKCRSRPEAAPAPAAEATWGDSPG